MRSSAAGKCHCCIGRLHAELLAPHFAAKGREGERIAFPTRAGLLLAEKFMSPERARVMADLQSIVIPDEQIPKVAVRSCHRARREREKDMAERLLDSGMAVLVPEKDIPRHPPA